MRIPIAVVASVAVAVLGACGASTGGDPAPDRAAALSKSTTVSTSASRATTAPPAPRTTRQAASMAEQFEQMTSTSCREDVDPVACMYVRRAYIEFFERSAMRSVDASYHESLSEMLQHVYTQHDEFVTKGCPASPNTDECKIPLMISDMVMVTLGALFSVE
ncbi:hypothetical protein [Rhodococcus indonesiensis]|uniref:hypothetical protein n=1 Tax=Rhodococcus indonesiensis TaxID=3055869 RepID=UPI0039F6E6A4